MRRESGLRARKRPRQDRSRTTVEAILGAAAQIFREHGYAAGTTDRIAERAGVSIGSVYQYFPNKDALLVVLAERHVDAGFARLRELLSDAQGSQPSLEAMLRRFVEGMIALHSDEPELHRVLFEEAPLPPSLRKNLRQRETAFAGEIRDLLESHPEVSMTNPELSATLVVQMIEGLVHGFILHPPDRIDLKDWTEEIVKVCFRYLTV